MAKNAYVEKIRRLDAQHPGLGVDLNEFINEGKGAHWISACVHNRYGVRLKEDFIARYANYRNIFAEGDEDEMPMAEAAHSAESPPAGVGDRESSSAQDAVSSRQGRKSAKAKGQNSEPSEVTKSDIIKAIKRQVAKMFREVVAKPDSDAAEFVRILLLNEMTNEKLGYAEADFGKLVEAERKEADLVKRIEHEKFQRKQLKRRWRAEKTKLRETMRNVEDATAQGKALDHEEIFKQISAVIGVGQPLVERIGPQGA